MRFREMDRAVPDVVRDRETRGLHLSSYLAQGSVGDFQIGIGVLRWDPQDT